MWSHFNVPLANDYKVNFIGYCYNSVNIITLGVAQSDQIKRLLQYYSFFWAFLISHSSFWTVDYPAAGETCLSQQTDGSCLSVYIPGMWKMIEKYLLMSHNVTTKSNGSQRWKHGSPPKTYFEHLFCKF